MFFSASFTAKFRLVFVKLENTGKHFFLNFYFKANGKSAGSSKNITRDFQNSSPFERSACFYATIIGNFERFQYLRFETDFLENENRLKKTGVPFFI